MSKFNLSDWALNHRSFIWFLMIGALVAGTQAYFSIGRAEDPSFAIKTMVISGSMPGATMQETLTQVTDRIEKKLGDLDALDHTRSITRPGTAIVYVDLLTTTKSGDLPQIWEEVRNMMSDIRPDFPAEFQGFQFNDNFGDVFGNIYAFTADGYSPREVQDQVEIVKQSVQALPDSGKVEIFGTREEAIFLEFSPERVASLGLSEEAVQATLSAQNAIVPSGVITAGPERVFVRIGGQFSGADSLEDINLRVGDRFFRLSDVADIERGYRDPPTELFRYDGQQAIGLSIGMRDGANIIAFGEELQQLMERVEATLPIGIDIHQVANQPVVVEEAVGHFLRALLEAVVIVLAVSFVSLGVRAGLVVSLSIPLVLAITFVILHETGFSLQRISLGALIIALGLLVDDAMIAIESMISRLERGESLTRAASYAWTSIAFPMLTGTLVTVAGFIPIGLNPSEAGEFTFSLFVVIAVSLVVSWIVAVLFTPVIGVTVLPRKMAHGSDEPGRLMRAFEHLLVAAVRFRWVTIGLTAAAFALSVYGMRFVEQQFFPSSDRPELIVDFTLPQNTGLSETKAQMDRMEAYLAGDDNVLYWTSYVGRGAPRFILSYDVLTPATNTGQMVIQTPSVEARNALSERLQQIAAAEFPGIDIFVKFLEIGPPVGRPVQYRISGPGIDTLRTRARDLTALIAADPRLEYIVMDWNEPARVMRVNILQDEARRLGITQRDIAGALDAIYEGTTITQLRDDTYLIDIVARGDATSRKLVEALPRLQISASDGRVIPLLSVATFAYETETPVVHQRDRVPTITIKAAIATADQPATIVADLQDRIDAFADGLPVGYSVAIGGTVENSSESQAPIAASVPLMLLIMVTLIMMQMQSFRLTFVVLCVAPLGLIGVVAALLLSGAPLGFVAILGVLALIGILIRNSVILVEKIEALRSGGMSAGEAVIGAATARARPILLTAAAASLALIPISRQIFWGPMAYAMMGGIIVGTLITLLFAPALYAAVFRVKLGRAGSP